MACFLVNEKEVTHGVVSAVTDSETLSSDGGYLVRFCCSGASRNGVGRWGESSLNSYKLVFVPGYGWRRRLIKIQPYLPFVPLSWRATMTISRKNRETLMCFASTRVCPPVRVLCTRSDPARSTCCWSLFIPLFCCLKWRVLIVPPLPFSSPSMITSLVAEIGLVNVSRFRKRTVPLCGSSFCSHT